MLLKDHLLWQHSSVFSVAAIFESEELLFYPTALVGDACFISSSFQNDDPSKEWMN